MDRSGPQLRAAALGMAFREGVGGLQGASGREQNRADEEGPRVGRVADEIRVPGERADDEARRPDEEEQGHPPLSRHPGHRPITISAPLSGLSRGRIG